MKIPEGWPTEEMIEGGSRAFRTAFYDKYYSNQERLDLSVKDTFAAMLAAAPTPPAHECKCDMRTRLVGDGCEICNPELVKEMAAQEDEPVAWPHECEELCKAAEGMQRAINELWKAEYPEELDEDQDHMDIDQARELHVAAWNTLHAAIHYMRKRMKHTRPDNNKLREAAESVLLILRCLSVDPDLPDSWQDKASRAANALVSALEDK